MVENIPDCLAKEIVCRIWFAIIIIVTLFLAIMVFIPKKVTLTDDKIIVYRFCCQLQPYFWDIRGLNDRIYYSKIERCEELDREIYYGANRPFVFYNKDSVVKITTKYKDYFLPIKNAEDFVEAVNEKINLEADSAIEK